MRFSTPRQSLSGGIVHAYTRPILLGGHVLAAVCAVGEREQLASGQRRRQRATRLSPSEIMTILILFQQSDYRTFTHCYTGHVQAHVRAEFP